jgi:hypothetical protein
MAHRHQLIRCRLIRDRARHFHICTETGLTSTHICTGTGLNPCHIRTGTRNHPAHIRTGTCPPPPVSSSGTSCSRCSLASCGSHARRTP